MNPTFKITIEMESGGEITGELYPEMRPRAVYNFIALANSVIFMTASFSTASSPAS